MKKLLSVVLCLLMLTALFAGCTKNTAATTATTAATAAATTAETTTASAGTPVGNGTLTLTDDPVTLTFWLPVNDVNDSDEMKDSPWPDIVADFEAAYPNVTITMEGIGQDSSENMVVWNTAAAANNLPELFESAGSSILTWQDSDVITEYSQYLSDDYYNAYADTMLDLGNCYVNKKGEVYTSPITMGYSGWILNTSILNRYNLSVPKTWDDMLNVCSTLTNNGVLAICQGGADTWAIWGYHEIPNQYGWNRDQCKQFESGEITTKETGFYHQFQRLYELAQTGAFAADVSTTKYDTAGSMFMEGQGAIWQVYYEWRWGKMQEYASDPEAYSSYYDVLMNSVFTYGFDFDDDIFKADEANGIKVAIWGIMFGSCVEKDPQKLAACVAFVEFMVSKQEYEHWVDANYSIPLVWTSDKSPDYSMWGLEQSYQKAYSIEGTWFDEPTCWFTKSIVDDYRNAVTGLLCGTLTVDGAEEIFNNWQVSNATT